MFDLFNFFAESEVGSTYVSAISPRTEHISSRDNFVATLKYTDGSVCTLIYTALVASEVPEEYIEIYCDGKTLIIDDFKELKIYRARQKGWKGSQDKSHLRDLKESSRTVRKGGAWLIPLNELVQDTKIIFKVDTMVRVQ
jgi:predicted dehydrogenase